MRIAKTTGEVRFDHDQIDGSSAPRSTLVRGQRLALGGRRRLGSPLPKTLKRSKLTTQYRLIRQMSVIMAIGR
jgi:hypothetical protein